MAILECSSCGGTLADDTDILCATCSYLSVAEVLICTIGTCTAPAQPEHTPCCSSHERALCCEHYCWSHFVEVHKCSPETHAAVA